jgi:hypothetical protein
MNRFFKSFSISYPSFKSNTVVYGVRSCASERARENGAREKNPTAVVEPPRSIMR